MIDGGERDSGGKEAGSEGGSGARWRTRKMRAGWRGGRRGAGGLAARRICSKIV